MVYQWKENYFLFSVSHSSWYNEFKCIFPQTKYFNQLISMLKNKTWSNVGGWILLIQMVLPTQSCLLSPYLQKSLQIRCMYNSSCTHQIICMYNIAVLPYRQHRERWRSLLHVHIFPRVCGVTSTPSSNGPSFESWQRLTVVWSISLCGVKGYRYRLVRY